MRKLKKQAKMDRWTKVQGILSIESPGKLKDVGLKFRISDLRKNRQSTPESDALEGNIKQKLVPDLYSRIFDDS